MRKTLVLAALLMSSTTFAFAQETGADTVLATVGGVDITLGQIAAVKRNLPETYSSLGDDVLLPGILDQLIQQEVLAQSLVTEPGWMASTLLVQKRSLRAEAAVAEIEAGAVSDEDIRAAYEAQINAAGAKVEWNAAHILVETEEEAKALVATLEGGADFAELAKEKSTGPSGPNGGSLGWFGAGMMVPEFETAVSGMEAGGISAPVQTEFGWHVIKLNETRDIEPPTFDDVREDIAAQLASDAVNEKIAELQAAAEITKAEPLDPAALSAITFD